MLIKTHWGAANPPLVVLPAAQLQTREVSWRGSMSWREHPALLALVAQGGAAEYRTLETKTLEAALVPGATSERLPVSVGKAPTKVSNTRLVTP